MEVVTEVWDAVVSRQPRLDSTLALASAAVALALVAVPGLWRRARHLVTIAHEGGHGVAALLTGRRLAGIRLHSDTSGLTVSKGRPTGPGMVATALAGYTAPALLGLAAAYGVAARHPVAVLWVALLLLALLLLQIRNFFGLYAVGLAAAGVFAVSWWGSGQVQSLVAHAGAWFLLLAAPRTVLELARTRRAGAGRSSDADVLARLTRVPGAAWVGVFGLVALGALLLGGSALLGGSR
ncbi:M50 family metallopeptidase [uncultured Nocardioides sp.]|uniref:M50 family metallopeptidase n=1 Tax=uncultured Nocardioides sp. TaxID=198441 RepID=UPI0026148586|nr:M50 family metallopeptidase [uncultured Nocardioides sp.]